MGNAIRVGTEALTSVQQVYADEFYTDPTEDMQVADFALQPGTVGRVGATLYVRRLNAKTIQTFPTAAGGAVRSGLTNNTDTDQRSSASAVGVYSSLLINRNVLSQIINDASYRANQQKLLRAAVGEKIDTDIFANAATLSRTVVNADLTDDVIRSAMGSLRTYGKNKYEGEKRLFIHTSEMANALGIPAIKEYQIRGRVGAATEGTLNAYGMEWKVSGLVYAPGPTAYNPLILRDAWFLGWGEKVVDVPEQIDGLASFLAVYCEYCTGELFDSSGVSINTTI